jgi:hypothetical protein
MRQLGSPILFACLPHLPYPVLPHPTPLLRLPLPPLGIVVLATLVTTSSPNSQAPQPSPATRHHYLSLPRLAVWASHSLPFSSSISHTTRPFDHVHYDLWTSPTLSISGYKCYLVILDDFSHYMWTFPLRHKSDTFTSLTYLHECRLSLGASFEVINVITEGSLITPHLVPSFSPMVWSCDVVSSHLPSERSSRSHAPTCLVASSSKLLFLPTIGLRC